MPAAELPNESLRLRMVSAAVLIPLAVAAAYAGGWVFVTLVGVGVVLLANEWDRLCGGDGVRAVIGLLHAGVLLATVVLAGAALFFAAAVVVVLGTAAAALLAPQFGRRGVWPAAGIVYFAAPAIAIIWLRAEPDLGRQSTLWLLALVWATDVGAIAVGRTVKGPRLAPKISPAKTWSGFSGGLAGAALAGAGAAVFMGLASLAGVVAISIGLALVSQIGDLLESVVKRHFGVKDSGTLIPGHGGILDRVDGLLLVAPAAAILALANGGSALSWPS